MRYAGIIKDDVNNGKGVGLTLFTQGCSHHCKKCQNPETWNPNGGKEFTDKEFNEIIDYFRNHKYATRLTLSGGDPLENIELSLSVLKKVKEEFPYVQTWVYSGYEYENTPNKEILNYVDVMIDGPFKFELRDITLKFRGSSNQRIINVPESLKQGEIILYEFD